MLLDAQLIYSDAQAVTATANSTNYVDHGVARDLGAGHKMVVLLQFGAVTSNATLTTTLEGADDTGFSTNKITLAAGKTITPVASSQYFFPIPSHIPKRYTRLVHTLSGGTSPSIAVTATLVLDAQIRDFSRVY